MELKEESKKLDWICGLESVEGGLIQVKKFNSQLLLVWPVAIEA